MRTRNESRAWTGGGQTHLGVLDGLDGEPFFGGGPRSAATNEQARANNTFSHSLFLDLRGGGGRGAGEHGGRITRSGASDVRTSTRFCALFGSNCLAMACGLTRGGWVGRVRGKRDWAGQGDVLAEGDGVGLGGLQCRARAGTCGA